MPTNAEYNRLRTTLEMIAAGCIQRDKGRNAAWLHGEAWVVKLIEEALAATPPADGRQAGRTLWTDPTIPSKGGHARAAAMTPEARRECASKAGRARWDKQKKATGVAPPADNVT